MKTIIQSPTNSLENSIEFYSKLHFDIVSKKNPTVVSDGKAFIEVNQDRYARAGIKLYGRHSKSIQELSKIIPIIKTKDGYILSDISGVWIYLIETDVEPSYNPSELSTSLLGNFVGLSIESLDIKKSIQVWNQLGFSKNAGVEEQGWLSLQNEDKFCVTFLKANICPHLFFNPSLTYFNGNKNEQIIKNIRNLNITITEEITHFNKDALVDNIIIRDPGGLGYFIFND